MVRTEDYQPTANAALRLEVSERLVRRWCKEGKLECVKIGQAWLVKNDAQPDLKWRRSRGIQAHGREDE